MSIDPPLIGFEKYTSQHQSFSDLVYTPLSEAKLELYKRRENKELTNRMWKFFEGDIPKPLLDGPKALLFRQLFTPNFELRRFIDIVYEQHIDPLFFEYHEDKFTSHNPLKHALGKMRFLQESENHDLIIKTKTIIDFNKNQGQRISDIDTIWGQKLIKFHHALVESTYDGSRPLHFDASRWFQSEGVNASQFYLKYMALFLQNAILFENFVLDNDAEFHFVESTFLPAFIEINRIFGFKPLIVRLLPENTQSNPYWISYPVEVLSFLERGSMIQ